MDVVPRGRIIAVLLAWGIAGTAGLAGAQQTDDRELAQRHFERGVELYDRGEHEQALSSFQTSYELVPSPNSLLFMARALTRLGRRTEAADTYAQAARDARSLAEAEPRYAPTAAAADEERAELLESLGRVVVRVDGAPVGLEVRVGGRVVPPAALDLPVVVEPGAVEVVATTADGRVDRHETRTVAGGETVVVFDLSPLPAAPEPAETAASRRPPPVRGRPLDDDRAEGGSSRAVGWIATAVGAAGWAALAVFGALARAKHEDLVERCDGGPCPPELQSEVDRGRLYETLANVGLVVGAVGTTAGLVLLVLVDVGPDSDGTAAQRIDVGLRGAF